MSRPKSTTLPQPVFREPVFDEVEKTVVPSGFLVPHPSDKDLYKQIQNLLKKDVVSFDKSRIADGDFVALKDIYGAHGPDMMKQITGAGKIIFHALGDSGATTAGAKYRHELGVADQLTMDCHTSDKRNRPSFLFHLGDVVYDFGESQYYYDQFYDPFRNYPLPIFAIPGNHDSFVTPGTKKGEEPLTTFSRNFCASKLTIPSDAKSLHRTAMTQPGVYFTLDAPYVRIIGLFSNSLEDPGLISSQNGKWPTVPDFQLPYLTAQVSALNRRITKAQFCWQCIIHPSATHRRRTARGQAAITVPAPTCSARSTRSATRRKSTPTQFSRPTRTTTNATREPSNSTDRRSMFPSSSVATEATTSAISFAEARDTLRRSQITGSGSTISKINLL